MPRTPGSVINAEKLPRPVIGDVFDAEVKIGKNTLMRKRFTVTWSEFANREITIDPIVELWRPINEHMRVCTDLNLGIFKYGEDKKIGKTVTRTYEVSYGAINRAHIDAKILHGEADRIIPAMLISLRIVCGGWATAEDGLAQFLRERNKSSIDEYLMNIGIKKRKDAPLPPEKKPTKEERRQAYLRDHPEHARTAQPHRRAKKKPPTEKPQ